MSAERKPTFHQRKQAVKETIFEDREVQGDLMLMTYLSGMVGIVSEKAGYMLAAAYLTQYLGPTVNQLLNIRTLFLERRGKNNTYRHIRDERTAVRTLFDAWRTGEKQNHVSRRADIYLKNK